MCFKAIVPKIGHLQWFLTETVAKHIFFQNSIGGWCLWSQNTKKLEMQPLKVCKM